MKLVIDMNLSPEWVTVFVEVGHECEHWSTIGSPGAEDREILSWARDNQHIVFTNDLDFGAILAATQTDMPSVLQIRAQDLSPTGAKDIILQALERFADELASGALVTLDENGARARVLPIRR